MRLLLDADAGTLEVSKNGVLRCKNGVRSNGWVRMLPGAKDMRYRYGREPALLRDGALCVGPPASVLAGMRCGSGRYRPDS